MVEPRRLADHRPHGGEAFRSCSRTPHPAGSRTPRAFRGRGAVNALIGGGARPPAEFVVERPGLRTTVQDLGRYGYARFGVGRSGAADWFSAALANRLVGNPGSAAVLEITLRGPRLRVTEEVIVAVAGA
ncbi:MAG: hypothetical protein IRZ02_08345, partial [Acidothermus sp.]|nr:hypothetical protein [Acidothermus sp.]